MKITVLLLILFLFISCSGEKKLVKIEGETMGTYYRISSYTSESAEELKESVDHFLKLFNNIFSTYISTSEISKINNSKFDNIKISDSMKKMLELSNIISKKSKGHFDITVAPLVNAWGFGPNGKQKVPTDAEIKKLLENIGHHKVKVKDNRLHRALGVHLDMSAIAKGFGVDELVKFLEFSGHHNMLVEIGGEVRTRGKKLDGKNWKVGIEGPAENLGAKIIKVVSLNNLSMATSGSYRNYVKYGDKVFNHTIDPHTGRPIGHKTISVTVVDEYCADADAWATAFMSMGAKKGLDLANKNDLKVLFQVKQNNKVQILTSKQFDKLL